MLGRGRSSFQSCQGEWITLTTEGVSQTKEVSHILILPWKQLQWFLPPVGGSGVYPTAWRRRRAGRQVPLHPEGQALLWEFGDGWCVSRGGDWLRLSSLCPLNSCENTPGKMQLEIQGLYLTQGDRSLCDRKLEWVISAVLEPNPGESDHQHHLGNLNKIGRYSPHPRNTRSEILAQSPGLCALSNFPGNSDDKPAQGKHALWNPAGSLILEIHSSELYWHRKHSSKSIWKIWQSHGNMDKAVLF